MRLGTQVIPIEVGIHYAQRMIYCGLARYWIPAFAGMTPCLGETVALLSRNYPHDLECFQEKWAAPFRFESATKQRVRAIVPIQSERGML